MKQTTEKIKNLFKSLPNYVRITKSKQNILRTTLFLILIFLNISGATYIPASPTQMYIENEITIPDPVFTYTDKVKIRVYDKLLIEVTNYMNEIAPNSKLNPDSLTSKCLDYDMDIIFVLAQGVLESHLGTKGKAAETNSVWNVGTYDNGKIIYRYSDPNESIEPYLQLLKKDYLINVTSKGDTIYKDLHHLIRDKGYKNMNGHRFASARGYEDAMRRLIVEIDMQTSISLYQNLYQMPTNDLLAYFSPDEQIPAKYELLQAMENDKK